VVDEGVRVLLGFSGKGADFAFQTIEPHFIDVPTEAGTAPEMFIGRISPPLKTVAFWILPTIIFFSSLMAVLYHLGVMQQIVRAFAWVMQRTMGTSGAESLSTAANIFVGQTEAPLLVRPFIQGMTRSELHAVMVGGFATVAGGVMATYVIFLRDIPGIAGHLVAASIMSAPAALAIAKILVPEDGTPETLGTLHMHVERPDANVIEALARGATEGLTLMLNVLAMLIAFVAIIAMLDWFLGLVGTDFSTVLGWLFSPVAFVMGVPWQEAPVVGRLLGEKLVLTELIAYSHLGDMLRSGEGVLSERSAIIASYALCGFANFASIGIQIGGIGGIAPERRRDLAQLGLLAMVGGSIAAFLTATIAGILL
jgi:CNT family concentrative nucleoside transporter